MRARVNWEIEAERHDFYGQLCDSIENWQGRVPNLRLIFRKEEIDWLLVKCVQFGPTELISFVISTGYRDEPNLDEQGQPRWHCMTPFTGKGYRYSWFISSSRSTTDLTSTTPTIMDCRIFTRPASSTSARKSLRNFFDHGQDANCLVRTTRMSPLHLAVVNKRRDVADILLRRGADPNLANNKGLTELHMICGGDRGHTVEVSLESEWLRNEALYMSYGASSLRAAQYNFECVELVKLLVRSGADPNLIDKHGWAPLHIIAHGNDNGWLVKKFLEICRDAREAVRLDAVERSDGRTPLHTALDKGNKKVAAALLKALLSVPNLSTHGNEKISSKAVEFTSHIVVSSDTLTNSVETSEVTNITHLKLQSKILMIEKIYLSMVANSIHHRRMMPISPLRNPSCELAEVKVHENDAETEKERKMKNSRIATTKKKGSCQG
ncbi:hypothetical protein TKK_0003726 [Trichogramma kaykai]